MTLRLPAHQGNRMNLEYSGLKYLYASLCTEVSEAAFIRPASPHGLYAQPFKQGYDDIIPF